MPTTNHDYLTRGLMRKVFLVVRHQEILNLIQRNVQCPNVALAIVQ